MERVVTDASVIVKWFIEEEYSEEARLLRDSYINSEIEIISPELLPFEVLNALKYSNLFNIEEMKKASVSLSSYGFRLYQLAGSLAQLTVQIAMEKNITVYDASYIALAEETNTKLYTADSTMVNRAESDRVLHISSFS